MSRKALWEYSPCTPDRRFHCRPPPPAQKCLRDPGDKLVHGQENEKRNRWIDVLDRHVGISDVWRSTAEQTAVQGNKTEHEQHRKRYMQRIHAKKN